jgi:hypothetical protein
MELHIRPCRRTPEVKPAGKRIFSILLTQSLLVPLQIVLSCSPTWKQPKEAGHGFCFLGLAKARRSMEKVSVQPRIKCFISAKTLQQDKEKKQNGLIGFAIPDLGVLFKTRYFGSHYELEYVSLLVLLRFIELNSKAFENLKLHVLCSSPLLVYQLSERTLCQKEVERHRNLALTYKRKFGFSLSWVPEGENRAQNGVIDLPALKNSFNFNFEDLQKKPF